jgi:hypothetical protein
MPAWGHTVGYIYLAAQMLQKDPTLVITMVQHNSVGALSRQSRYLTAEVVLPFVLSSTDGEGVADFRVRRRQAPDFGRRRKRVRDSIFFCISLALTSLASICSINFGPYTHKQAFEQLLPGWMEVLPQIVQGSEGWPKPRTIHVRRYPFRIGRCITARSAADPAWLDGIFL